MRSSLLMSRCELYRCSAHLKALISCFVLVYVLLFSAIAPAMADSNAEALFDLHCAGCHINGGNIIRRGKTLKKRAMNRNGYQDIDAIAQIITQGKGAMTAFADRLSDEEVSAIAQYVHEKAETGW